MRDTRLFSAHLDSGRQFWLSASMAPLVFPDKLVSSHPVGDIIFSFMFGCLRLFHFIASTRFFMLHSQHYVFLFFAS